MQCNLQFRVEPASWSVVAGKDLNLRPSGYEFDLAVLVSVGVS
jgi:hypothetical protein